MFQKLTNAIARRSLTGIPALLAAEARLAAGDCPPVIARDRVLAMMQTATSEWSDVVGAAVVGRNEGSAS